jgi:hypothetical protein
MSGNHDYVPKNDREFDAWFKNIARYVTDKTGGTGPEWTHIPPGEVAALNAAYAAWYGDYSPTLGPHTPGDTARKDAARKTANAFVRDFVQRFLAREPVTDPERVDMALRVRDKERTEHGAPVEFVEFFLKPAGPALLEAHFKVRGAEGRARPEHTTGAVFYWYLGEEPPAPDADWDEFNRSDLATRTPFTLHLREGDRGKRVHVNARWQGVRGAEKGPWTETQETIVP